MQVQLGLVPHNLWSGIIYQPALEFNKKGVLFMSNDPIKDALRMLPYGFYSITSRNEDEVNIMVANWFTQVSFEPRLVALGLQKTSYSHGLISKGRVFAVNMFNEEDEEHIIPFCKGRAKNPDKVTDATYTLSPVVHCPIVEGAAAYLECQVRDIVDINGDHDIVVAEVVGAGVSKPGDAGDTLSLPKLGWSYAG
jgi:flavin reductase (DIM6/NTAB) family NADH-FMN oxidoreductase RutF